MINPMSLDNKTIIITGASSGIGKTTATRLAELGASVIMIARNESVLKQIKKDYSQYKLYYYVFDLCDTDNIDELIENLSLIHI